MVAINWTENLKNDLTSIAEFIAKDSLKFAQITIKEIRIDNCTNCSNPFCI